jgi:ABC-type transport system involved in cytochrome bd biosynthesis fused ATPase/permease subunit
MDSPLGPKGRRLSGGQRRRVALARALHDDRPVLVLDEFSTGLDAASTARVLEVLRRSDRTVLVVAHDPVVAAAADQVLLLEDGTIRGRDGVAGAAARPSEETA